MKGVREMLILSEKETCPYNKACPNKNHEGPENEKNFLTMVKY